VVNKPILRPDQVEMVARINREILADRSRGLAVCPTGYGKTVVTGAVIAEAVARGGKALVLSHRREITTQTSRKLVDAGVIDHGIVQSGLAAAKLADREIVQLQARVLPPGDLGIDEGFAMAVWRLNLWRGGPKPPSRSRPQ